MFIDLHVHQNLHSKDSQLTLYQAIQEAKKNGLGGICITDHDDLGLRSQMQKLTLETGLLVIVGVEIYTLDGDLLCFGIDEMPEERMSAQATIDFVHARGGVCIAAHPYRKNNRGLKDLIKELKGLDAIEVYNGRTEGINNERAMDLATQLRLPMTGGSDAHKMGEIGSFVTQFMDPIKNEMDLVQAVRAGRILPVDLKEMNIKSA